MHRQAIQFLPALNRSQILAKIPGNLLPGLYSILRKACRFEPGTIHEAK
jgi:hypothetical protein